MAVNNTPGPKTATNVSLKEALLVEDKDLGVKVSQAAEAGPARAVSYKRAEIWAKENMEAITCYNAYVRQNGLPLDEFRMF
ncbi:type II toxin-antitoxin system CcdA family antitoxin [Caballeronia concitans]|uniref:Post-segregation antitoxin CcdA n=1 Tax=Caballeronia concitans TaxID=1777133 RepID=A0A658R5A4_9BURK|nr:type II toxin-antitoxin system CcdA family antitoxin [Caballeronia concitans]SAL51266.1 Post-segregation antitoxin CcdA [Caballeronia concitans]